MLQNKLDDIVHTEIRRPGKLSLRSSRLHTSNTYASSARNFAPSPLRDDRVVSPTESPKVTSVSIRTHSASSLVHPPSSLTIKALAECCISALSIGPPEHQETMQALCQPRTRTKR